MFEAASFANASFSPKNRCEAGGCKVISHKENTIWIVSWGCEASTWKNDKRKKNDNAWKHHLIDIGVFRQPDICICHKHVHVYMYNIYIYTIYHSIYIYIQCISIYIHTMYIYIYTLYIYIHKHIMYVYITYMWLEQKHITTAECNFIQ